MQKSFHCPHCDKKYPVLPTLVGRKVRCTACKNVFQLQYDGIAIKVGGHVAEAPVKNEPSALESKAPAPDKAPMAQGVERAKASAKIRPQTQAIRRKTERIKKIRSSLQDAAEAAVDSVALDSGMSSKTSARAAATAKNAESLQVVLTNSGNKEGRVRFRYAIILGAVVVLLSLLILLFEPSREQMTLSEFTAALDKDDLEYPRRMEAYRQRMWIYTRDGLRQPPIILNADDARAGPLIQIDWTQVVSACAPELEDLEFNRRFAIWHEIDKNTLIEELWDKHPSNLHLEEFYITLGKNKIRFIRFESLPPVLLEKGLSKQAIYIASLFLAGTSNADGKRCKGMGLQNGIMPSELMLYEFSQPNGHILISADGGYRYSSSKFFCGLIAGFTGFPDQADEWRLLDLRTEKHMDEFYSKENNPLILAAQVAYENLRDEQIRKMNRENTAR